MIDPKSFAASLIFVCGFAGITSIAGLVPVRFARELFDGSQRSFSLVDLFALGAIQVTCFGYMWSIFPDGDNSDQLAYALGVGCVATFWWFIIATRLAMTGMPSLARGVYLWAFVSIAFVCPFIVATCLIEIPLTFDVRPALRYGSNAARATIASFLFFACIPLNRWLLTNFASSTHPNQGMDSRVPP